MGSWTKLHAGLLAGSDASAKRAAPAHTNAVSQESLISSATVQIEKFTYADCHVAVSSSRSELTAMTLAHRGMLPGPSVAFYLASAPITVIE